MCPLMPSVPQSVRANPKPDMLSASDETVMWEFVILGQSLGDKPVARLIELAVLVQASRCAAGVRWPTIPDLR
jgi:hypothetical protein